MIIDEDLLPVNEYSRPGRRLYSVNGLAWHWVANPMTTPKQNRSFFESRKAGGRGYGSAHYIIGIHGNVLRCIPEDEMAFHCGAVEYKPGIVDMFGPYPNATTLSIELCHEEWDGAFTEETTKSLFELSADICFRHGLRPCTDIVRHFDITGKDCPRWYVANPIEFEAAKSRVAGLITQIKQGG